MAEDIIEVPKELVQNCNGFSMDFGGSVLKLVYRHKDDWKDLQTQKDTKTGKLRLHSYAGPDFKDALELLKENAYISRDGENTPVIYTTGVGCYQNADIIKTSLDVKTEMLSEFDCFVKSFCYFVKCRNMEQMEVRLPEEVTTNIKAIEASMIKRMKAVKQMVAETKLKLKMPEPISVEQTESLSPTVSSDKPIEEGFPDLYPCGLVVLGSGFAYLKVKADGGYELIDGSNRGGRMFLGLGSLLSGDNMTYSELMDLAMKGNNQNVGIFRSDLRATAVPPQDQGDKAHAGYSMVDNKDYMDDIVFCFGKSASNKPDSFKKEDLIRGLLHTVVLDLVQNLHHIMRLRDFKRCFLCGSFINHELVRQLIMEEWAKRKILAVTLFGGKGLDYELHFLSVGSHLGAIGALVNHTESVTE